MAIPLEKWATMTDEEKRAANTCPDCGQEYEPDDNSPESRRIRRSASYAFCECESWDDDE